MSSSIKLGKKRRTSSGPRRDRLRDSRPTPATSPGCRCASTPAETSPVQRVGEVQARRHRYVEVRRSERFPDRIDRRADHLKRDRKCALLVGVGEGRGRSRKDLPEPPLEVGPGGGVDRCTKVRMNQRVALAGRKEDSLEPGRPGSRLLARRSGQRPAPGLAPAPHAEGRSSRAPMQSVIWFPSVRESSCEKVGLLARPEATAWSSGSDPL